MASLSAGRSSKSRAIGTPALHKGSEVGSGSEPPLVLIAFTLPVPALYPVQAVGNTLLACLCLQEGI
jgi:hypothetical protein